jgi:hypothetical protein
MSRTIDIEVEIGRLRGPALVAWLVTNTEKLVVVASTLDERAADLSPSVPRERVVELCQAIRHASLELTVALLSLLTQSDRDAATGALADAVANAHVRIQELGAVTSAAPPSTIFSSTAANQEKPSGVAAVGVRRAPIL